METNITLTLTIEQALAVQGAVISKLPCLQMKQKRLEDRNAPKDVIKFTEEEIQNLEAVKALLREAIIR